MQGGVGHSWFSVRVAWDLPPDQEIPEPDPVPETLPSGGGTTGWSASPVSVGIPRELSLRGSYGLSRRPAPQQVEPVAFTLSGSSALSRRYTIQMSASSRLIRAYEFSASGTIKPAERWLRLLREDEEILDLI